MLAMRGREDDSGVLGGQKGRSGEMRIRRMQVLVKRWEENKCGELRKRGKEHGIPARMIVMS